jgi:C-terminal peptidase prc
MKKYISIVFVVLTFLTPIIFVSAESENVSSRYTLDKSWFRDVSPNSSIRPALDWAVENDFLDSGGFFRASEPMPSLMFWPLVIKEAGFDEESATFNTPLPPNVSDDDPLAQVLREAIRRDFLSAEDTFDPLSNITQLQALSVLVKTKALLPPRRTSSAFQTKFDLLPSREAEYFPLLETALASNMITEQDVKSFRPQATIDRGTVIGWLYRFATEGKKQSLLEANQSPIKTVTKRKNVLQQKLEKEAATPKTNITTIRVTTGEDTSSNTISPSSLSQFNILEKIFADLSSQYRFPQELTTKKKQEMIEAATEAMVRELGDKYTAYIKPAQSKEYEEGLNGELEGIGAFVEMLDGKVVITAPITGSPAELSGIMPGDIVTHVDGVTIEDESLTDSVQKIKGPAGTKVVLKILRGNNTLEISVIRGKIQVPSVTLKWERSVPILGLHQFNRTTGETLLKKINEEILPKSTRGIILDLRNNPGGYLTEAVEIGEIFLNKGQTVFSTEYKNSSHDYISTRDGELKDMNKIIVLQNEGTASASEILISALKDYNRVRIIGKTSHGKGVVQNLSQYNNGGILKVTIAKWISPNGTWLDGKGITPDIEIDSPTLDQKKQNLDPQLERAIQELLSW